MRLATFIAENTETILEKFEEFARTHTAAGESMDIESLRDHASGMLAVITLDMEQPQSERDQKQKSRGDAPGAPDATPTAAGQHGAERAGSGFTLAEMFSEYRALRASVLRLWTQNNRRLDEDDLDDMIRFNEAIDQALAESITEYSTGIEQSREMFLAILGHDLRSPLGAVLTASNFLIEEGDLTETNRTMVSRIRNSGERMLGLVSDLLDFTRSRLGSGIPVARADVDLATITREAVEEISARHPEREFRFETTGDCRGQWDGKRVSQAVSNLVENAVKHGTEDSPILIAARGENDEAIIAVQNRGAMTGGPDHDQLFAPFRSIASAQLAGEEQGSMGLGLYIAEQITIAHGGRIDMQSSEETGTTFEIHLPR